MNAANPKQLIQDIDDAVRANNMGRALDLAATAIMQGIETPRILNITAYGFELRNDYFNALRYLRRALAIAAPRFRTDRRGSAHRPARAESVATGSSERVTGSAGPA